MAFSFSDEYPFFIDASDLEAARSVRVSAPFGEKERVACIGAGPSSLACAAALRSKGYAVTVFEERAEAGGTLRLFLPRAEVESIVENLKENGVEFVFNRPFSKDFSVNDLKRLAFRAVFLGLGLQTPVIPPKADTKLIGVTDAFSFLRAVETKAFLPEKGTGTVIVGNGAKARLCAVCAKKAGAKNVFWLTDGSFAPCEGVSALCGFGIAKTVAKDGRLFSIKAVSRNKDSEAFIKADTLVFSVGDAFKKPNAGCALMSSGGGLIKTQDFATSKKGFFAGGEAVNGTGSISDAVESGKAAAKAIDARLTKNRKK